MILTLGTLFCVAVSVSGLWQGNAERQRPGAGDVALYWGEVDRIHNGEGYYQAAAAELTARGYPTKSVFNWRTPLPMWLIGKLPQVQWGKYLLGALSLSIFFFAFKALLRDKGNSLGTALGCVLLLSGPLLFTVLGDLFVMPELWAGVLIAFSLCAYGVEKPLLGLGLGLTALFIRELALPYCLLCAVMAYKGESPIFAAQMKHGDCPHPPRRMGLSPLHNWELIAWILGLGAWLVFFGWHWWQVSALITPNAFAHEHGWIRFGGAGFVLATAQMNAYLVLLPPWITALYFAAAIFGLAGWHTPWGTRIGLTVCLYVLVFAVAGQKFNQYWGTLIGPLFCFGVAQSPWALKDLWRAATISVGKPRKIFTWHECRR